MLRKHAQKIQVNTYNSARGLFFISSVLAKLIVFKLKEQFIIL